MFRRCACSLALAALLIVPGSALAAPFQFVYTDTVSAVTGSFPGISIGDTFTVTVVADNGSSSIESQQWLPGDIVSASLSIADGVYSASYTPPGDCVLSGICFETDANGDLTTSFYEDDLAPLLGTDSFGSDGLMLFSHLSIRNSPGTGIAGYVGQSQAKWAVVPQTSTVPAFGPLGTAMLLSLLGLLGLSGLRKLRA
jgi:hypothetical protein